MTVGVIGNSAVIFVMTREKWLKNKTSFYNMSTAVADLIFSILVIVMTTIRSIVLWDNTTDINFLYCVWITSILFGLSITSLFHLVFVSIDRYWAVCHPILYHNRTETFSKRVVAFCWVAGMSIGISPLLEGFFNRNCSPHIVFIYLYSILGFCCITIIAALYGLTFKAIVKQV